ncbi:FMN-linked oxidoreductase [Testicularia cyperi]|uniref:tRNA-dihydrouridine synthase n=1 Tax=Testicularia cyperi TaxID=1882483 RepID=A0A317XYB5_9BASI|nr:FMN-linked oxidoreductase [Testicularia cyperi]
MPTGARRHLPLDSLRYCSAPMVNQSDLPFRLQTVRNGATSVWTQMYLASELTSNQETLEILLKSLELGRQSPHNRRIDTGDSAPQIVQLAANDPDELVKAARQVAHLADAIDLNLGCPQHHAQVGGYGAYLLSKQHWPQVERLVESLSESVDIPVTTKIRLTVPKEQTPELAVRLSRAGSSLVTLHPRFASSVRRRKGLADLEAVQDVTLALKDHGLLRSETLPSGQTAVVSNGNVRFAADIPANLRITHASGVMVGETLLDNPALFHSLHDQHRTEEKGCKSLHSSIPVPSSNPSSVEMAKEYLDLRAEYNAFESPVKVAKQHLTSILCSPLLLLPQSASSIQREADHLDVGEREQQVHLAELHRQRTATMSRIKSIQSEQDLADFHHSLL